MTIFNIFHTIRVGIGVRDAPYIWGAGEIRDAGERRLFGGLARSEPFVAPHIWGTGEMSTEISATYLGRWGNKLWKLRRIYVALDHDELTYIAYHKLVRQFTQSLICFQYEPIIVSAWYQTFYTSRQTFDILILCWKLLKQNVIILQPSTNITPGHAVKPTNFWCSLLVKWLCR